MDGYKEAMDVDAKINKLLEENPITTENAREWIKFGRTAMTSFHIVLEEAKVHMGLTTSSFRYLPPINIDDEDAKLPSKPEINDRIVLHSLRFKSVAVIEIIVIDNIWHVMTVDNKEWAGAGIDPEDVKKDEKIVHEWINSQIE